MSRPLVSLRNALRDIGKGNLNAKFVWNSRDEFGEVGRAVNEMTAGLREREAVKSAFARYVSADLLENVLQSGELPKLQGDRRRVTVLFSDIRGFTTIAEKLRPEEVVGLLNEYFAVMIDVVFRNRGTLDKFLGDGMMVVFGAPVADPLHEEHAVRSALEMQREIEKLRGRWTGEGKPPIRVGIGINSGNAIVGNVGTESRTKALWSWRSGSRPARST